MALEVDLKAKPTIKGFRKAFEEAAHEESEYIPNILKHQYDIDRNIYYWSPESVRKFYQYHDKRNKRKREKQRETRSRHSYSSSHV